MQRNRGERDRLLFAGGEEDVTSRVRWEAA